MLELLRDLEARYEEVTQLLGTPEVATHPQSFRKYAREHAQLEAVVLAWRRHQRATQELEDNRALLQDDDPEIRELARAEEPRLKAEIEALYREIQILLLPKDPLDEKNTILEIRAGTGGDEAALFAGDLLRMFLRYAERRGWQTEMLNSHATDIGGYKEVSVLISGDGVYSRLKFEGGVHRVQRVPATESQGRIHTSACTVAIMAEVDDVEVQIRTEDLRIDTFRASGAGGQHVNMTDSAVRITHLPSGLVVSCQDEKSQHKNKAKALKILQARLFDQEQSAQAQEQADARRAQVGSGDRSERIRTYNFPQNRVTDHRINLTLYALDHIIAGDLDDLLDPLLAQAQAEALQRLGIS
jgi:peptide chain release factor 1